MATSWSTPFRLAQTRANRLTLTPVLGSSQSGIEPKVIEQRDFSGKVVARLRITPGASAGEFQFEVEDFKQPIPARAVGSGKISDTEVRVQIVETASGTQLGLRAVVNGGRSSDTQITLSLNRLSFDLIIDEKVRTLLNELQKLIASGGDDAKLIALARKIDHALQITTGYRAFCEHVKDSAAFDILTTTRSLIAMVSGEQAGNNPTLAAIRHAMRFLAPSVYSPASVNSTKAAGSGQILQIAYAGRAFYETSRHRIRDSNPRRVQCVHLCDEDWQRCHNGCTQGGLIEAGCEIWCAVMWVICVADCII